MKIYILLALLFSLSYSFAQDNVACEDCAALAENPPAKMLQEILKPLETQCGLAGNIDERIADCAGKNSMSDIILVSKYLDNGVYKSVFKDPKTSLLWTDVVAEKNHKDAEKYCEEEMPKVLNMKDSHWRLPNMREISKAYDKGASESALKWKGTVSWSSQPSPFVQQPNFMYAFDPAYVPFKIEYMPTEDGIIIKKNDEKRHVRCVLGEAIELSVNGSECFMSYECLSGMCANQTTDGIFKATDKRLCIYNGEEGAKCETNDQCYAKSCVKNICKFIPPKGSVPIGAALAYRTMRDGEPCLYNENCRSNRCRENICRKKPSSSSSSSGGAGKDPVGASCDTGYSCKTGWCSNGLCGSLSSNGSSCDSGESCKSKLCVNSRCSPPKGNGASCDVGAHCQSGLCYNSKCGPKSNAGAACFTGDECDSRWCSNNKCAALKPDGSSCNTGYACISKWCSNGRCKAQN